jgi:hypothetical protein
MLAVGGDDPVVGAQHRDDAGGDRLLAVIEMQEAADLLLGVELGAFVLEPPDADHAGEQVEHMRAVEMGFVVSSVMLVGLQGRDVALGQAQFARLQQAAHDLAAAGLGQVLAEHDLARRDGRAELLAGMAAQLAFELVEGSKPGFRAT